MKKQNNFILLFLVLVFPVCSKEIKLLHLSFHKGCIKEIEYVSKKLNIAVTSLFIPDLKPYTFDEKSRGNQLYNIGQERAERIWIKNKNFFESFDAIITSDTVPLSRIFLQNNFSKPLIIWVCNRFDYSDQASNDCNFPDASYYEIIKKALKLKNVFIVTYSEFENYYAKRKNINFNNLIIKPTGCSLNKNKQSFIPSKVNKNETFFIPEYHNNTVFMNLSDKCRELGVKTFCGKYNGANDLVDFKGIINLPGAWSNFALFENLQNQIPYFVPSIKFLFELVKKGNYFIPNANYFFESNKYFLSEWYNLENQDFINYFDSWDDLKNKIETINFNLLKKDLKLIAQKHEIEMICRWKSIFDNI